MVDAEAAPAQAMTVYNNDMLAVDLAAVNKRFCDLHEQVAARLQKAVDMEEERKRREDQVEKVQSQLGERLAFDVGGVTFAASKQTLLNERSKGSYFYHMLSSGRFPPGEDGKYFIDRNPKVFGVILDYLRYGFMRRSDLSIAEQKLLAIDLDYFQLVRSIMDAPWGEIDCTTMTCSPDVDIEGKRITKMRGSATSWSSVLASEIDSPSSFTVKVISRQKGNIMIGLAQRSLFTLSAHNYSKGGWFFYVINGTAYSKNGDSAKSFGAPPGGLTDGQTIELHYDRAQGTIHFVIAEKRYAVFTEVRSENEPLYPCVEIYDVCASVEMVDCTF